MNTKKQRSKYQKKQRVIILLDGVFDLRNVFYKVLWNEHSGGRMIPIPICTLLGYSDKQILKLSVTSLIIKYNNLHSVVNTRTCI